MRRSRHRMLVQVGHSTADPDSTFPLNLQLDTSLTATRKDFLEDCQHIGVDPEGWQGPSSDQEQVEEQVSSSEASGSEAAEKVKPGLALTAQCGPAPELSPDLSNVVPTFSPGRLEAEGGGGSLLPIHGCRPTRAF